VINLSRELRLTKDATDDGAIRNYRVFRDGVAYDADIALDELGNVHVSFIETGMVTWWSHEVRMEGSPI
jgi:hypothetical protein